jgi:hypothetical protein
MTVNSEILNFDHDIMIMLSVECRYRYLIMLGVGPGGGGGGRSRGRGSGRGRGRPFSTFLHPMGFFGQKNAKCAQKNAILGILYFTQLSKCCTAKSI